MTTARESLLDIRHDERAMIRTLTMQRLEKANALDATMVQALDAELAGLTAATDQGATVILRSAHRAFSAGFDLSGVEDQTEGDILLRFVHIEGLLQRLRRGPLASIAVIEGAAYGAGADLAIACTWRIGTPRARFRFPGFRFGVALGTRHLAAIAGQDRARQILLENRMIPAEEALEWGLLTHLVEPAEIETTIATLAGAPADLPGAAAARIIGMTRTDTDDADLADMVRSLAEPGLKNRIAAYLRAGAA
ncbi:enoyl-CoA hydratase/isomerase family protein [Paracoccus onubensis]|nr:enoyl-CoA hydratase/isomerase family protein [Paracoccus onubensis]